MAAIERRMIPLQELFLHPFPRHPLPYGRSSFLFSREEKRSRSTHDPPRTTIHWNSIHDGGSSSAGTFGPSRIFFVITHAQAKEFACFRRFRGFARNERSSVVSVPMLVFWCNVNGRNDGGWSVRRLRNGWDGYWKRLKIAYEFS